MKIAICTLMIIFTSSCAHQPSFESAGSFERYILALGIIGESKHKAITTIEENGFKCRESLCARDILGFPCKQKQYFYYFVDESQNITNILILRNTAGELSSTCV